MAIVTAMSAKPTSRSFIHAHTFFSTLLYESPLSHMHVYTHRHTHTHTHTIYMYSNSWCYVVSLLHEHKVVHVGLI